MTKSSPTNTDTNKHSDELSERIFGLLLRNYRYANTLSPWKLDERKDGNIDPIVQTSILEATDQILALIMEEVRAARIDELQERVSVLEQFGSGGDKINGNARFMAGVETAEDHLRFRIEQLTKEAI